MKRLFLTAALLLAALTLFAAKPAEKIRLTEEQQLKGLPQGVIGRLPLAVKLDGKGNIVLQEGKGRYVRYNLYQQTRFACLYSAPKKMEDFAHPVEGWVNPTWSPDSTRIAYTLNNDLYSIEVATGRITRHTWDGSDLILNGYASWVYFEEIFGRPSKYRAFWWSPDSKLLAYYRFDNARVPMFPIYHANGQHGFLNQTRYPAAGDPNPVVKVGFVSVNGGETVWADFNPEADQYFGIPFWSSDGKRFMVAWMPRSQDDLELFSVDPLTGAKVSVYKEHQDCWIDWMEEMLFSKEGIYIVRDFSGWQQIYFLSYDGKKFEQLTEGPNWTINLLKVSKKYLFFTAKRESSTRVDIYRLTLKSKALDRISWGDLSYSNVLISEDDCDVVAVASNTKTPPQLRAIGLPRNGNLLQATRRVIEESASADFKKYDYATADVIELTMRDGVKLPALVVWPVDLDTTAVHKYPVKAFIYGGPDTPRVRDAWGNGGNQWWANHGVIQVVLDNRGSGHLGKKGLEQIYRHLGDVEIRDFIDGISYFRALPYVNPDKIGVEGFSFGGTMTALCVMEGSDYFKYGIAGGGVYDWALYDSHYTERYMDTPQDNPEGYARTRVTGRTANYKGDKTNMLRITHGTADDNVHYQSTLHLIDTLQKQCKDFELMLYPQALHGYRMKQKFHSDMQDYKFWYRYLLDAELPETLVNYFTYKKK